jgi:hypothetical protein
MSDRLLTYDELAAALGRSPEAVRQLAKRKRWRRIIGNDDGKARVAVPTEVLDAPRPLDVPRSSDRMFPERPPVVHLDADAEASADARTLIAVLEARVSDLVGQVKEAQTTIATLTTKAARVDVLEALLEAERKRVVEVKEAERQRADDLKAERDRWAAQAERLSMRTGWWPFRRRA